MPEKDMRILVAKADKRKREHGKETIFHHHGNLITQAKMENFKRRKFVTELEAFSPSIGIKLHIGNL
jgi:hypothetical protein